MKAGNREDDDSSTDSVDQIEQLEQDESGSEDERAEIADAEEEIVAAAEKEKDEDLSADEEEEGEEEEKVAGIKQDKAEDESVEAEEIHKEDEDEEEEEEYHTAGEESEAVDTSIANSDQEEEQEGEEDEGSEDENTDNTDEVSETVGSTVSSGKDTDTVIDVSLNDDEPHSLSEENTSRSTISRAVKRDSGRNSERRLSHLSQRLEYAERKHTTLLLPDEIQSGSDVLTNESRNIHERTKMKLVMSLCYGALAFTLIGMVAIAWGRAQAYYDYSLKYEKDSTATTVLNLDGNPVSLDEDQMSVLMRGFGFSGTCYFVAALLIIFAAIRMSPHTCGTPAEKAEFIIRDWDHVTHIMSGWYEGTKSQGSQSEAYRTVAKDIENDIESQDQDEGVSV